MLAKTAPSLPVGRVGLGEDIARQILSFMANGFATGSIVYIDGGALVTCRARETERKEQTMASETGGAFIRNIAEVPWREFPNYFGGALSKPLVMPETAGSRHIDYRLSMYQA